MDKMTMRLRALIQGRMIEHTDVYFGHTERFLIADVEREDSGFTVVRGSADWHKVYIPSGKISELMDTGECSFSRQYDMKILEYRIKICKEE